MLSLHQKVSVKLRRARNHHNSFRVDHPTSDREAFNFWRQAAGLEPPQIVDLVSVRSQRNRNF
jgi:hypothetical protein